VSAGRWPPEAPHALTPAVFLVLLQFLVVLVMGIRLLSYYYSFAFHWPRYRRRAPVSTAELRRAGPPFLRLQVTTRGLPGSSEVIVRGVLNVAALAAEDPAFYRDLITVEICTESAGQGEFLSRCLDDSAPLVPVSVLVVPEGYQTPAGTQKKARSLHYATEMRRTGWGRRPGRTFVVHYDEESVIEPAELRKLLHVLAATDHKVLEGPIYYPLEYTSTSVLCRAMEANRPIGCFECRSVMERGIPQHLHGSNLVVEEEFENEIGWDLGTLDGQPFIAEDYVFGILAFLRGGRRVFGWHGVVMLEQPPFSYRSAFRQRQRWITGVLQGQRMLLRTAAYRRLPARIRVRLIWGTRFRVLAFALGAPAGLAFLGYLALELAGVLPLPQPVGTAPRPPLVLLLALAVTGTLWLGSVFIGAWLNVAHASLPRLRRATEIGKAVALTPVAGLLESAAGLWAVIRWLSGHREVSWQPTPKTRQADRQMNWSNT